MRMPDLSLITTVLAVGLTVPATVDAQSSEQGSNLPSTADRPMHSESALPHDEPPPPAIEPAALPEGMTLEQVLDYAESEPPESFPEPVFDDKMRAFIFMEQLEYRVATDGDTDHLGWEAQGWVGWDYDKFWWKNEGEAVFEGNDHGESETDLLYSRLITPFWNLQLGAQYANEWSVDDYEDRWSGVVAIQGVAPYKFELDNSLYVSEDGDVTAAIEAEYDIRITQRLVLQPRTEIGLAAQDIPDRDLAAGVTGVDLDLRLRYEIRRDFAPYIGLRYGLLVGQTANIAEDAGRDPDQVYLLAGLRFAF
jgi:copper resistance protein B